MTKCLVHCTVGFVNSFLRVPLVYLPWCLPPCCQGKLGELSENSLQNLLYEAFCHLVLAWPVMLPPAVRKGISKGPKTAQISKALKTRDKTGRRTILLFDHESHFQASGHLSFLPFILSCQGRERRHGKECWTTLVPPTRLTHCNNT